MGKLEPVPKLSVLPLSVLEACVDCGAVSSRQDPSSAPHCLLFPWELQRDVLGLPAVGSRHSGSVAVPSWCTSNRAESKTGICECPWAPPGGGNLHRKERRDSRSTMCSQSFFSAY